MKKQNFRKASRLVLGMILLIPVLLFADRKFIITKTSNLEVDVEKFNLKKAQLYYSSSYNLLNLRFTKRGVRLTTASKFSQVNDHDFELVDAKKKINYFNEGKRGCVHFCDWDGEKLKITYDNQLEGHSTNIVMVFELKTKGTYVEGMVVVS